MSECYREVSIMRRPWPTRGRRAMEKNLSVRNEYFFGLCGHLIRDLRFDTEF